MPQIGMGEMEFSFTDEQQMIAETVRGYFAEHATSARTRAAMAGRGIDEPLWQGFCRDLCLSGVAIDEAVGGAGLGFVELAIVAEAAGAHLAAMPHLSSLGQVAQGIAAGGTSAQQGTWLPKLLSGDVIGAYVQISENAAGQAAISGTSDFVAHGGAAELLLVDDGAGMWLVPSDSRGVQIVTQTTMDQTRPMARVTLDGAQGEALANPELARHRAQIASWIIASAEALGGAQKCLDETVGYAKERVQFGRPIGSFQAYKHRLADMMIEIEQARSAVYWAACCVDEDAPEQAMALHAAKSFCADTYFRCAGDMIQLHGGIGFTWEHDAHLYFKRARSLQTMLGHGAWHREEIAKMMLGEAA